jgi:hypothetical protein
VDLSAVVVIATLVPPGVKPEAPKGPDQTQLCVENATDGLVGVWIWRSLYPFASRVVAPATTDCLTMAGHSQKFMIFVGRGEDDVPGTAPLFPDPVSKPTRPECPSYIEGGQLRFRVTKQGDAYRCQDAR